MKSSVGFHDSVINDDESQSAVSHKTKKSIKTVTTKRRKSTKSKAVSIFSLRIINLGIKW